MMKVLISLLFTISCAAPSSIYKISHKHLEREPGYVSVGLWVYGSYWVEILDDQKTTWPFDEAVWKFIETGAVYFVDVVCDEGNIHRYGARYKKGVLVSGFSEIYIIELRDGSNMNPFQYFDLLINQGSVPI